MWRYCFEIMTISHSSETQEFVVVFPPTVVTIVLNATTIAAVVSTLGRFLHAEVSELKDWTVRTYMHTAERFCQWKT